MKIIVIADTHGNFDVMDEIVSSNLSADMFIHLGDGEREYEDVRNMHPEKAFIIVRGNNDERDHPITKVLELEDRRFYITHGAQFGSSSLYSFIAASAKVNNCSIALFGHTHEPLDQNYDGVRLFNPGSASLPRGMSRPSYGVITIEKGRPAVFKLVEL